MADLADLWPDNYERRPPRRLAVTMILDVSADSPERLTTELRDGIIHLDLFLQQHAELRYCVDFTLIARRWSMAHTELKVIHCEPAEVPDLSGKTNLSAIVDGVLRKFEKPTASLSATTSKAFPHWLVLLSEGGSEPLGEWARHVDEQVRKGKLTVIPVVVGKGCDTALALALGSHRPPLRLQQEGAVRFFSWLGKELQRVVAAKPGKRVYLNIAGMADWAQTDLE